MTTDLANIPTDWHLFEDPEGYFKIWIPPTWEGSVDGTINGYRDGNIFNGLIYGFAAPQRSTDVSTYVSLMVGIEYLPDDAHRRSLTQHPHSSRPATRPVGSLIGQDISPTQIDLYTYRSFIRFNFVYPGVVIRSTQPFRNGRTDPPYVAPTPLITFGPDEFAEGKRIIDLVLNSFQAIPNEQLHIEEYKAFD
jgi:hypothetical protein